MPNPAQPEQSPAELLGLCNIAIEFHLSATDLLQSEPLQDQVLLGEAACKLADGNLNGAVSLLLGTALDYSMRADDDGVSLAIGAAVHVLRVITIARTEGTTL